MPPCKKQFCSIHETKIYFNSINHDGCLWTANIESILLLALNRQMIVTIDCMDGIISDASYRISDIELDRVNSNIDDHLGQVDGPRRLNMIAYEDLE